MRGLGQGIREFKKGTQDITEPISKVKEGVKEALDNSTNSMVLEDYYDNTERQNDF